MSVILPIVSDRRGFVIHRGPYVASNRDGSKTIGTSQERTAHANAKLIINHLKGLPETNRVLFKRMRLITGRHKTRDVSLTHLKKLVTLMKSKKPIDSPQLKKIVGDGPGYLNKAIALLSLHYNVAKAQVAHIYNKENDRTTLNALFGDASDKVDFMDEFKAAIGMRCKSEERQKKWDGIVSEITSLNPFYA